MMHEPEYCTNHGKGAYYCGECVDEEKRRADRAVALLSSLEWSGGAQAGIGDGCDSCCPSCGAWAWSKKHESGCELAAFLNDQCSDTAKVTSDE